MLFPSSTIDANVASTKPMLELISHVWMHRRLFCGAAIGGLLITGLLLCFVTPYYRGEAVVIIDSRHDKLAEAESAVTGIVVDQYQTALKSELALITSPALARTVIVSQRLLDTPEFRGVSNHVPTAEKFAAARQWIVDRFNHLITAMGGEQVTDKIILPPRADGDAVMENAVRLFSQKLRAENDLKSLTLRIDYESADPVIAANVSNAVLDRYLAQDAEMKKAAAQRSEAWLRSRMTELRTNLEAAEHAVESFRAQHELTTVREQAPLEAELLQLHLRRIDAENQVSLARAKAKQTADPVNPDALSSDDVLASRSISSMRQFETQLQAQKAAILATILPDNRRVQSLNDQIASVKAMIQREISHYSLLNQSQLTLAEARVTDITTQIGLLQTKINIANIADIKLRSLEQDAAAARAVLDDVTRHYNQITGAPLTQEDSRVVSRATVPVDPFFPRYSLMLLAGMMLTVGLVFGWSIIRLRVRRGFYTIQQLGEEIGLLVAGLTPVLNLRLEKPSPMRELATTIRALAHTSSTSVKPTRTILVTSTLAKEGKTTVALALARSVADAGQRCLLIDADVRQANLHTTLHVTAMPGLVDLMLDRAPLFAAIRNLEEGFDLLPAGSPTADVVSPFATEKFGILVAELKKSYDVIIFDSAPIFLAPEGLVLAGCVDLTLFLVKWRTTPREIARKAVSMLTRCSSGTCLAVLTQVNARHLRRGDVGEEYRVMYRLNGSGTI